MTKNEWQQTADERLLAAEALLQAGLWSSAYYLAGYAAECGLKACVLARLSAEPELVFDPIIGKRFSDRCWTHKLAELVSLAGRETELSAEAQANPEFGNRWSVVQSWSETSRYEVKTEGQAKGLVEALAHATSGVMTWIRLRW